MPPLSLIFTVFSLAGNHHNQRAPNLPLITSYNPSSSGKNKKRLELIFFSLSHWPPAKETSDQASAHPFFSLLVTGHQQRKLVIKPPPINSQPWGNLKKHTHKVPLTFFFCGRSFIPTTHYLLPLSAALILPQPTTNNNGEAALEDLMATTTSSFETVNSFPQNSATAATSSLRSNTSRNTNIVMQ